MADLVAIAETARNRYTSLADKAAAIYAPVVHLLALAAFLFWFWYSGDWRVAMNIAVAVLIITCPCALGLAVPAVTTAAFWSSVQARDVVEIRDCNGTAVRSEPRCVRQNRYTDRGETPA